MTTQDRCSSPPRSPTIVGSAVETIVWSSAARNMPSISAAKIGTSSRSLLTPAALCSSVRNTVSAILRAVDAPRPAAARRTRAPSTAAAARGRTRRPPGRARAARSADRRRTWLRGAALRLGERVALRDVEPRARTAGRSASVARALVEPAGGERLLGVLDRLLADRLAPAPRASGSGGRAWRGRPRRRRPHRPCRRSGSRRAAAPRPRRCGGRLRAASARSTGPP